jgi:Protein of unknown function DUF262
LPKPLQLNEFDRSFFRDSMQSFHRVAVEPTKNSHKLILKAYAYLSARVREGGDRSGGGENGFRWAARLSKTLTEHVSLVTVVSTDEDHAASIFETLNDRGIGLSTADLLRSWLLHHSPVADREEIIECWSDIFDSADTSEGAQTLIRLSWVSRHGDVKERSLYKVISRKLTETHMSSLAYSRQLRTDALFYRRVRDGDTTDVREHDVWPGLATPRAQSGYALSCFSLSPFVSDRRDAGPSTSPVQLSPGVHLPIGTATSTSAVSCAATMPRKANKVSRSRESESKKECFYRENWRHRNYLPEPAIFRHSKLRL